MAMPRLLSPGIYLYMLIDYNLSYQAEDIESALAPQNFYDPVEVLQ
jgi:hypothetical protein